MAHLIAVLWLALSTATTASTASEPVESLPDQAQVRVLGRVTTVGTGGRSFRIAVDGMTFAAEVPEGLATPPVRVGDRVLLTGLLQPLGRVLIQTLRTVVAPAGSQAQIAMLLSVNLRERRMIVRTDGGKRVRVRYGPETTFVRLGRRSSAQELKFGDRLWIGHDEPGGPAGPASRIEVMAATGGRFSGMGRITAVDSARQQLRVEFGRRARTVLADKAVVRGGGGDGGLSMLRVGAEVRISGIERRGVIVARSVELAPGETLLRTVVGRVQSVDRAARRLRLFSPSLVPMTTRVRVPVGARVEAAGHSLTFRTLRVGDRVRVQGQDDGAGGLAAQRVERLP
jgi:hypothetical protein